MIDQIKKVIEQIDHLSVERQLELAKLIQEEISWDDTFASSQQELSSLANEAIEEFKKGTTSDRAW